MPLNSIPISETISLKSAGLDETWLQNQIWDNPTCLGLGALEGVTKERAVSSGGRLDLLFKDPNGDLMYEVETMLGETDPDHIVRTIEYWDLVKRKWPQRQHYAVLIAERITKRFFNVIQLLSNAVPLIAIQANIVRSPHGQSLHFTKILDVYEEPDDETDSSDGTYDEAYWVVRSGQTLEAARNVLEITKEIYVDSSLKFNKYSISIASSGYNQMTFRNRSGSNIRVEFRYGGKHVEVQNVLDAYSIPYSDHRRHFKLQLPAKDILELAEMFQQIAQLNNDWWVA